MTAFLPLAWSFSDFHFERIGWVLVHTVWQFALVALVTGATVGAMRRKSAASRYGVLIGAMALSVVFPVATWVLIDAEESRESVPVDYDAAGSSANNSSLRGEPEVDPLVAGRPVVSSDSEFRTAEAQAASWSNQAMSALRPWLTWIVVGWSIGILICSSRPLMGWRTLRRLRRLGVESVPEEVLSAMHRMSQRLGVRRTVGVLNSTLAQAPIVIGYLRPIILLPVSLATSIPTGQLESILAHELSHVRRHDFLVNLLQTLVETVFFYHPAVWWLSREIRIEREHCCDDLVVSLLGNRIEYGRALIFIAEMRGNKTALALAAADGTLLSRIRRIVGASSERTSFSLFDRLPAASLGLALIGVAFAMTINSVFGAKDDGANKPQPTIAKHDGATISQAPEASPRPADLELFLHKDLQAKLFRLKNAQADETVKTLQDLLQPTNEKALRIASHGTSNSVLVQGSSDQLERVAAIIAELEKAEPPEPNGMTKLFRLKNVKAAEMVKTLQDLFQTEKGNAPRIASHDTSNSVLVQGSSNQLQFIAALIAELDEAD